MNIVCNLKHTKIVNCQWARLLSNMYRQVTPTWYPSWSFRVGQRVVSVSAVWHGWFGCCVSSRSGLPAIVRYAFSQLF